MRVRRFVFPAVLLVGLAAAMPLSAQTGAETFTATAAVKTAAGAAASAPVRIVISRMMSEAEAGKFADAFKAGGGAALRKALTGVAPTGSVTVGTGAATPTRISFARRTDKGRLVTIVTDTPILFLGGGLPGAKPKEGYDFAIIDLELNDQGQGTGVISPAAKVGLNQGAFVVSDYSGELVKLTNVQRAK